MRSGSVPSTASINDYDYGVYYLLVDGASSTAQVGWLSVEYEVELFAPQLNVSTYDLSLDLSGTFTRSATGTYY